MPDVHQRRSRDVVQRRSLRAACGVVIWRLGLPYSSGHRSRGIARESWTERISLQPARCSGRGRTGFFFRTDRAFAILAWALIVPDCCSSPSGMLGLEESAGDLGFYCQSCFCSCSAPWRYSALPLGTSGTQGPHWQRSPSFTLCSVGINFLSVRVPYEQWWNTLASPTTRVWPLRAAIRCSGIQRHRRIPTSSSCGPVPSTVTFCSSRRVRLRCPSRAGAARTTSPDGSVSLCVLLACC